MRKYTAIWVAIKERYPKSVIIHTPTELTSRTIQGLVKEKSRDNKHYLHKEQVTYTFSPLKSNPNITAVTFTLSQTYRI